MQAAQINCVAAGSVRPVYYSPASTAWADSVLQTMSYQERIGQLFMVDAYSNRDSTHTAQIAALIDSLHIGGLIFFQGGPVREAVLTNYYQSRSKVPLMIGMDAEWGLSMRLDSTIRFPRQMTLSAGADSAGVAAMGHEIGRQCKRLGIHINFAPSVDINVNPLNPIINSRSFGENKEQVATMGLAYMNGMQDEHVLACAKHFPGHGNTDTDSHLSLPIVRDNYSTLDTLHLYPFRRLINAGAASVMVAHLYVPAVDSTANLPCTLSDKMIRGLLKDSLKFGGLIFTDALNMKGVTSGNKPGELELNAIKAGNDVLLYSLDIPKAISRIHSAIQECEITQEEIDEHVHKILMAKYWAGLDKPSIIDTTNLINDLNTPEVAWLNYQLYEPSVTLLRNKGGVVPISPGETNCIASLVLGDTAGNNFQQVLSRYAGIQQFALGRDAGTKAADSLLTQLDCFDRIIVSIHNTSINAAKNFNITETIKYITAKLNKNDKAVLCVFGNPYVLGKLDKLDDWNCLILGYEDTWMPQLITAQRLFGAGAFQGRLPVSPEGHYTYGMGISALQSDRVTYTLPESEKIPSSSLNAIDSIVAQAIRDTVMPGCQVLIGLHGKIIYDKAFGKFTYEGKREVKTSDLYDIASVTKMAGTALAVMQLVDKQKIDPDAKVSKYLPELRHSNKTDLTVKEILSHQAGLRSWIPFYKETIDSTGFNPAIYSRTATGDFTLQVADSLYILKSYRDSIWNKIIESPLETRGKYVYSDLGMIIMQHVVERVTGTPINEYLTEHFYRPLGLSKMSFNPLHRFNKDVIVPTEMDTVFRKQLIHGYVHDPAAAMTGGVSGHAGLFANAQSLAVIMQLLLNGGTYGGDRYISQKTVDLFTSQAYPQTANRRGLIFDKPDAAAGENGPTAKDASPLTFGHTGFTGTCAWADPEKGLVYIFLSNRVYPSAANNKLAKNNIRTRIMQIVYDSLKPAK